MRKLMHMVLLYLLGRRVLCMCLLRVGLCMWLGMCLLLLGVLRMSLLLRMCLLLSHTLMLGHLGLGLHRLGFLSLLLLSLLSLTLLSLALLSLPLPLLLLSLLLLLLLLLLSLLLLLLGLLLGGLLGLSLGGLLSPLLPLSFATHRPHSGSSIANSAGMGRGQNLGLALALAGLRINALMSDIVNVVVPVRRNPRDERAVLAGTVEVAVLVPLGMHNRVGRELAEHVGRPDGRLDLRVVPVVLVRLPLRHRLEQLAALSTHVQRPVVNVFFVALELGRVAALRSALAAHHGAVVGDGHRVGRRLFVLALLFRFPGAGCGSSVCGGCGGRGGRHGGDC